MTKEVIPIEHIQRKIFNIRNKKIMLDKDLAELYSVETKTLNRAVKRNIRRFPEDFMFRLTREEMDNLGFHFSTSKERRISKH